MQIQEVLQILSTSLIGPGNGSAEGAEADYHIWMRVCLKIGTLHVYKLQVRWLRTHSIDGIM